LGDIIIAGSDGFFDNMFEDEIIRITEEEYLARGEICEKFSRKLVQRLCTRAALNSLDETYFGPFTANARRAGQLFIGGKPDDTTVLVSIALKI
jgi:protein phosphatase PTC7